LNSDDANLQQTVRQYLLGRLAPEDSSQAEERLLTDDNFYQELLAGEDDLIDEYLSGELSAPEQKLFEDFFMTTPERHEKLRFGRGLKKYVNQAGAVRASATITEPAEPSPSKRGWFSFLPWQNPTLSYSLAAALVVILIGGVIAIIWNVGIRPQPPGRLLAIELTSGLSRGDDQIKTFSVTSAETVELDLRIDPSYDYQRYRGVLQTVDGTEKFQEDGAKINSPSGAIVALRIPARLLPPGSYSVKLSGLNRQGQYEDLGRYSFRVTSG